MTKLGWFYADKFGELPSGQAEQVEALVEIAEQLNDLNANIERLIQTMENRPA